MPVILLPPFHHPWFDAGPHNGLPARHVSASPFHVPLFLTCARPSRHVFPNTTLLSILFWQLLLSHSQWHAAEYQPAHRVASLFSKRSKLLQHLRAYGYRLQYLLPRSDWQSPRLRQLQVDCEDGRIQTDTFTDRFGTYPDLPFIEDPPSICPADRCAVLEAQNSALQAKIFDYRSHLGQALAHFAVYPHRPGVLELPRLVCDPSQLDICSFDDLMNDLAEDGLVPQAPIAYFLGLLFFPPHLALPGSHLHLAGLARSFTIWEDCIAAIIPDSSFLLVSRFQPPPGALTVSREQFVPTQWGGQVVLGRKLKKPWHRRSVRYAWDQEAWRVHQVRRLFISLGAWLGRARLSLKRKRHLRLLLEYQHVFMTHDIYKSVCAVLAPAVVHEFHPGNTHSFRSSARCAALVSVMRAGGMWPAHYP